MSFVNAIFGLGPALWLIIAVILFALETVVPGIHLLWFGLAALATAAFAFLTGVDLPAQIAAFAVLSVAAMFLVRHFAVASGAETDLPTLNQPGSEYLGRVVIVEEPIRGGRGKVRVGDTLWIAEGPEAPAGSRVRVKGSSGSVLVVERE
jgi:membrane protein implicated in regulation of membrane protease activity